MSRLSKPHGVGIRSGKNAFIFALALFVSIPLVTRQARGCEPGKAPGSCRGTCAGRADPSGTIGDFGDRPTFSHLVSLPNSGCQPDCNPWLTAAEDELFYIIRDDRNGIPHAGYQGDWDIYLSQWDPVNRVWGPGTNLGPHINTVAAERRPSTTATGDTLFFERDSNIFLSFRTGGVFGPATWLFPGRDPAITSDVQHIYYVQGGDIWVADRDGPVGSWTNHHALGPPVNSSYAENRPFVSADGLKLFFSDFGNSRPGGYGGDDIWVSTWTGSGWSVPVSLGPPIDTDLWSCSPFLSRDGKRFFTGGEAFEGSRGDEDLWVAFLDSTLVPEPVVSPPGQWTKAGELPGAWHVYDIVASTDGDLYAATMPGARVFRSDDRGHSWAPTSPLAAALIAYSLLGASDGSVYVGTYPHGVVFRTTDDGASWQPTTSFSGATSVRALLETSDGRILAGTSPNNLVCATADSGNTWTPLGTPEGLMSGVTTLFETTSGLLFAGGWGRPHRSDDSGLTWDPTDLDPHFGTNLSSIHSFLETEEGTLWCTGWVHANGGYVFKSNNGGVSWDTTGTIQVGPVHAVRVYDIAEIGPDTLLSGFQTGPDSVACISVDGGDSWSVDGALPDAREILRFLKLQDGTVCASTTPNGDIYRRTPGVSGVGLPQENGRRALGQPSVAAVFGGSPNPFDTKTVIRFQTTVDARAQLSIIDTQGRFVRALDASRRLAGVHEVVWDGTDDAGQRVGSGVYFVRLETPGSVTFQKLTRVP